MEIENLKNTPNSHKVLESQVHLRSDANFSKISSRASAVEFKQAKAFSASAASLPPFFLR